MINQPQENPNIPGDLVKTIEAVRNQITIGEAEVVRLRGLVVAENYTVVELNKAKQALTEETEVLEATKTSLQEEKASLTAEVMAARADVKEVEKEQAELVTKLDARSAELDEKDRDLRAGAADLAVREADLKIEVSTFNTGQDLVIEVSDQGLGISNIDQQHVFEKYFRCSTGNRHDVKGFGLGLSYVQLLIQAHGGRVDLKSRARRGTTVTITLPLSGTQFDSESV